MPEPVSLITIRKDVFAFNSHFVRVADLDAKSHVLVFTEPDHYQVGFKFLSDGKDPDSLALASDGGANKEKSGRAVQVSGLMRELSWLKALALDSDTAAKKCIPRWESKNQLWIIDIAPSFEIHVSDKSQITSTCKGIYRYKRGGEIVYIGRGQIRSRLNSIERENWDFEIIEYSLVENEIEQQKWESFWLDRFVALNGKLPIYNKILGQKHHSQTASSEQT
jgi:hypothetical protein